MNKIIILMYHSIRSNVIDPWNLCVSPENFASHIKVLRQFCEMSNFNKLRFEDDINNPSSVKVVLTFDDGYSDNLRIALPILKKYYIYATIFIISSYVNSPSPFYWDELAEILLKPGRLPPSIEFDLNNEIVQWSNFIQTYTYKHYEKFKFWRIGESKPPTQRHDLYISLWKYASKIKPKERIIFMDFLRNLNVNKDYLPSDIPLSISELRSLSSNNLIEIGGHSVNHQLLSKCSYNDKVVEIIDCKKELEMIIGKPINIFSYPHGVYDSSSIQIVKNAGYKFACTTIQQSISKFHLPYEIPRFHIKNWNEVEFERRIKKVIINC